MASQTRARLNNLNDRAREFAGPNAPQLSLSDARHVINHYNHTCLACGTKPAISIDHVIPLSKGGLNRIENLQLLCQECNKSKRDTEIDYRNGDICTENHLIQVENYGGKREGAGRKAMIYQDLKLRIKEEKRDDAEYAFAFYAQIMRNPEEELPVRMVAADKVLDRVLGKPAQMQPQQGEDLYQLYAQGLKQFIYGDTAGETTIPEGIQSLMHRLRSAAPSDTDSLVA